jgi:nickel transport protein
MDILGMALNKTRQLLLVIGIVLLCTLPMAAVAHAHGTSIELIASGDEILIHALFDSGEPMSNAQISVYAPDNPREAWLTGEADADGRYSFTVDTSINGAWAVSIRTAGHGELLHFNVTRSGRISLDETTERTPQQTALIAGGVVAALGGIAWYFSRKRKKVDVAAG